MGPGNEVAKSVVLGDELWWRSSQAMSCGVKVGAKNLFVIRQTRRLPFFSFCVQPLKKSFISKSTTEYNRPSARTDMSKRKQDPEDKVMANASGEDEDESGDEVSFP